MCVSKLPSSYPVLQGSSLYMLTLHFGRKHIEWKCAPGFGERRYFYVTRQAALERADTVDRTGNPRLASLWVLSQPSTDGNHSSSAAAALWKTGCQKSWLNCWAEMCLFYAPSHLWGVKYLPFWAWGTGYNFNTQSYRHGTGADLERSPNLSIQQGRFTYSWMIPSRCLSPSLQNPPVTVHNLLAALECNLLMLWKLSYCTRILLPAMLA